MGKLILKVASGDAHHSINVKPKLMLLSKLNQDW